MIGVPCALCCGRRDMQAHAASAMAQCRQGWYALWLYVDASFAISLPIWSAPTGTSYVVHATAARQPLAPATMATAVPRFMDVCACVCCCVLV